MNSTEAEKLGLALVSAYVWVASADDGVDMDEYNKFQHVIVESPFATQINVEELLHSFKGMVRVFETNYDQGIQLTRERIQKYSGDAMKSQEILRMARAAIVADAKINESEEVVLAEISQELGISQ